MCDLIMPGLAEFILTNYLCKVFSLVRCYIIRCYNRRNQLHESGRSVDCSSNTCLRKWLIRHYLTVLIGIISARVLWGIRTGTSVRKCRGMPEYVRKPSFFPLAREEMFVLACGALLSTGGLSDCASVVSDR